MIIPVSFSHPFDFNMASTTDPGFIIASPIKWLALSIGVSVIFIIALQKLIDFIVLNSISYVLRMSLCIVHRWRNREREFEDRGKVGDFLWRTGRGNVRPSIKYVTLDGEGVREGVRVCDMGEGVKSLWRHTYKCCYHTHETWNLKWCLFFCFNRCILTQGGMDKAHPGQNLPD